MTECGHAELPQVLVAETADIARSLGVEVFSAFCESHAAEVPFRTVATLLRMAQIYTQRFADPDGRIRATFDVIWLSGWAPHESQQQPLKPGSATASLAEAVRGPPKT